MTIFLDAVNQGLYYGILAMGVVLTYKILDFPDLSVDSTAPLGGVICALTVRNLGQPVLGLLLAFLAGVLAGCVTGILHVNFKISPLLCGIMVMTGLYSINLWIGNTSNLPVFNHSLIFNSDWLVGGILDRGMRTLVTSLYQMAVLLVLVLIIKLVLDWFLSTRFGFLIRITGDNPQLVHGLGADIGKVKIAALAIANGLAALYGATAVQYLGMYDITMGSGTIAAGLAAVILGTTLFRKLPVLKMTGMVVCGAVLYRLAIALAYRLHAPISFERLVTVLIFFAAIALNNGSIKNLFHKEASHD